MNASMRDILDRHRAFWHMEDVSRPLVLMSPPVQDFPLDKALGAAGPVEESENLEPWMLAPDKIPVPALARWAVETPAGAGRGDSGSGVPNLIGDLLNPMCPYHKVPWMEAIAGCPIRTSVRANTFWAGKAPQELCKRVIPSEAWTKKLMEFSRYIACSLSGQYGLSATLMRGPLDTLGAMLGKKELVVAMHTAEEGTGKQIAASASLFVEMAKAQLALMPSLSGGYCTFGGIWAPGTAIRIQDDISVMLSPRKYDKFALPFHEAVARAFDYSIMDIHSGAELHILDSLTRAENIKAISVSVDPVSLGAGFENLLSILHRIKALKPVQLTGEMSRRELQKVLSVLSPRGLAVAAFLRNAE